MRTFYELIHEDYDPSCGAVKTSLALCYNKKQLDTIAKSYRGVYVKTHSDGDIKDSLSKSDYARIKAFLN